MSYRLQGEAVFANDIRRIAYEQIDDALIQLKHPRKTRDKVIHEARKCFKKLRALLRLVRDEIGETVYKHENICFRDAGRQLALVRDSLVMLQTLDALTQKHGHALAEDAFIRARDVLVDTHEPLLADAFAPDQAVSQVIDTVQAARERIADWPIATKEFAAFAPSLQRVYKRGYKRHRHATEEATPKKLHEWRKRVKYLWYHVRLLQPLWPGPLTALAAEMHDLSDYLGDDHDLFVLREWVEERPSLFNNTLDVLLGLIQQERTQLQTQAMSLGQRIYAEKPKRFVERFERYWQVWQ